MKISKIKERIEQLPELSEALNEAYTASSENPNDKSLKTKHMLAASKLKRAETTAKNYAPALAVTLGQFSDCAKEVFDSLGIESQIDCTFDVSTGEKVITNVYLTLNNSAHYPLFQTELENENQPLADVKVNLFDTAMLKGSTYVSGSSELDELLNIISWNAITKTYMNILEEKRIARAIKEEEKQKQN